MSQAKSREVVLPIRDTDELNQRLDALRDAWRQDSHAVPKGLSCSESNEPFSSVTPQAKQPWG